MRKWTVSVKHLTDDAIAKAFEGTKFGRTDFLAIMAEAVIQFAADYEYGLIATTIALTQSAQSPFARAMNLYMASHQERLNGLQCPGAEFGRIIFAKTNAQAKSEVAAELGDDLKCVSCCRAKEFDKHSEQGAVPNKVLLEEHEWNFECDYCSTRVYSDTAGRVWEGECVFWDAECNAHRMNVEYDQVLTVEGKRIIRQNAEEAARAKFEEAKNICACIDDSEKVAVRFNIQREVKWN